jgi:hypothetical protein
LKTKQAVFFWGLMVLALSFTACSGAGNDEEIIPVLEIPVPDVPDVPDVPALPKKITITELPSNLAEKPVSVVLSSKNVLPESPVEDAFKAAVVGNLSVSSSVENLTLQGCTSAGFTGEDWFGSGEYYVFIIVDEVNPVFFGVSKEKISFTLETTTVAYSDLTFDVVTGLGGTPENPLTKKVTITGLPLTGSGYDNIAILLSNSNEIPDFTDSDPNDFVVSAAIALFLPGNDELSLTLKKYSDGITNNNWLGNGSYYVFIQSINGTVNPAFSNQKINFNSFFTTIQYSDSTFTDMQ